MISDAGAALAALVALAARALAFPYAGFPPAPRAVVNRDSRRARQAHRRRDQHVWRTRALGKRPQSIASG